MRIINFGSLNIDYVYSVDHISRPGETVAGNSCSLFAGGKGAIQSVAIARAGGTVSHAGKIGNDGLWMIETMKKDGVDISGIEVCSQPSGHAIIQVDKSGQNSIVTFGGTNRQITTEEIEDVIDFGEAGDVLLLQNEINNIPYIINCSAEKGMLVCMNPAPMGPEVFSYPLDKVSTFIINEHEGNALTEETTVKGIMSEMVARYTHATIIITSGPKGCSYTSGALHGTVLGCAANVVDETGAGDTFVGYLFAELQRGIGLRQALEFATIAASISVTRKGAIASIPYRAEVETGNTVK